MEKFGDVIRLHMDTPRPLRTARVLGVSRYALTGSSYITVEIDGQSREAIYRDGITPTVGTYVQVIKMDAGNSPYLALPIPKSSCFVDWYFLTNGRVNEPADELQGSPGRPVQPGDTVRCVFQVYPGCRNVRVSLRMYGGTSPAGPFTLTAQALSGPWDGPAPGSGIPYAQHFIQASVSPFPPYSHFIIWAERKNTGTDFTPPFPHPPWGS